MLLKRLEMHAARRPAADAVVARGDRLSYAALRERALRLARALRARGAAPGALVAVHTRRTVDALAALLGAMWSGAAYTVVEEDGAPEEALRRLREVDPDLVVAGGDLAERLARHGIEAVAPGGEPGPAPPLPAADDAAYVMFTSGSTGTPKGVEVTHANVAHYAEGLLERLGVTRPLAYAHASTLAADLGNTSLLLSLWTGGALHLLGEQERRDPARLIGYLADEGVELLKITPSHWAPVLRAVRAGGARPRLEYLVLGGEALDVELVRATAATGVARRIVNHYGPTETTVGVTANVLADPDALPGAGAVPIGTPFGRTRALVRTDAGEHRARDAAGELLIGGPSVARGYRGDPAATARAFVELADGRFYRTGDRVRVDRDGTIEFLGRIDRQVKIRGFRVELEHVEVALESTPSVARAAAFLVDRDGRDTLAAAVVPAGPSYSWEGVRAALAERVPDHMIPAECERFDAFPLNRNGKTDLRALERQLGERLARRESSRVGGAALPSDPFAAEVVAAWRRHLRRDDFGLDDDFFAAGGDSIDAIQVIADLQVNGHRVSSKAFLEHPTVRGLTDHLRDGARATAERDRHPPLLRSTVLSPAQEWFFDQRFRHADHWNQAVLLEAQAPLDPELVAAAVGDLLRLHPLLRTAYRVGPGGPHAALVPLSACGRALTASRCSEGEASDHVARTAARAQSEIAPADGRVFRAHLFSVDGGPDRLLLACHHLSVDTVSWRTLVDDLVRRYRTRSAGLGDATPPPEATFWEWVERLRRSRDAVRARTDHWRGLPPAPAPPAGSNRERDAAGAWLAFGRRDTERLVRSRRLGAPIHAALLGAFAAALARRDGGPLLVDVESHGRAALSGDCDVSRAVGWFTSTFPVRLELEAADPDTAIGAAAAALDAVPDLGLPYALWRGSEPWLDRRPAVVYNYLGEFDFAAHDDVGLSASPLGVGPARGARNDRVHDLRLTGRVVDGRLAVDLSYSCERHDDGEMAAIVAETGGTLAAQAGLSPDFDTAVERGSTAGVITYLPRALRAEPAPAAKRPRRARPRPRERALLTGATGFLGSHVLRLLLERTDVEVACVVRPRGAEPPERRLEDAQRWHFGQPPPAAHARRCHVLAGDVAKEGYGLPPGELHGLSADVDAIYNLAADTRLFGDTELFESHNVGSVATALDLAASGRDKVLHHVSTLAVCGVSRASAPVRFSECDLDVGQEFQNEYERSKHRAELLVRERMRAGGCCFVYRAGNVAGDSRRGRFQRNGGDNRFVQFLRAIARLGRLPHTVEGATVFSPVDTVAQAIVAISRAGIGGGTFHTAAERETPLRDVLDALAGLGVPLERTDAPDFTTLFERARAVDGDPDLSLGFFWARRQPRNVRFDHGATYALLARLGVSFPVLGDDWLRRFLAHLLDTGALGDRRRRGPAREALPV